MLLCLWGTCLLIGVIVAIQSVLPVLVHVRNYRKHHLYECFAGLFLLSVCIAYGGHKPDNSPSRVQFSYPPHLSAALYDDNSNDNLGFHFDAIERTSDGVNLAVSWPESLSFRDDWLYLLFSTNISKGVWRDLAAIDVAQVSSNCVVNLSAVDCPEVLQSSFFLKAVADLSGGDSSDELPDSEGVSGGSDSDSIGPAFEMIGENTYTTVYLDEARGVDGLVQARSIGFGVDWTPVHPIEFYELQADAFIRYGNGLSIRALKTGRFKFQIQADAQASVWIGDTEVSATYPSAGHETDVLMHAGDVLPISVLAYNSSGAAGLRVIKWGEYESELQCSISCQQVHFVNDDLRKERYYPVTVRIQSGMAERGTYSLNASSLLKTVFYDEQTNRIDASSIPFDVPLGIGFYERTLIARHSSVGQGIIRMECHSEGAQYASAMVSVNVIEPLRKLITLDQASDRRLVNPSRLVYGSPATLQVGVSEGSQYNASDVQWSVVSGSVALVENGFSAEVTATEPTGTVVVEARFNQDPIQPQFVLPVLTDKAVHLKAFVVSDPLNQQMSDEEIRLGVMYANRAFKQVGVSFILDAIVHDVGDEGDWSVTLYDVYYPGTPEEQLLPSRQYIRLLQSQQSGQYIKVFFTRTIVSRDDILGSYHPMGILISADANPYVLAHEIGHAFGLKDIYDEQLDRNGALQNEHKLKAVVGPSDFTSHPEDWGAESGHGYYERSDSGEIIVRQLLMYGYPGSGLDIPDGRVRGIPDRHAQRESEYIKTGASDMKDRLEDVYSL